MSAPATPASSRFAFMVSVIPYLLDRGSATIDELAERFEIEPRLVTRLIETIALSGVPGETATYQDNDLFDIDWDAFDRGVVVLTRTIAIDRIPRLSTIEAAALVAGLEVLDSALPPQAALIAASVRAKLSGEAGRAARPDEEAGDFRRVLSEAALARRSVRIGYVDAKGETSSDRLIDPLAIERCGEFWYLRAWSHVAEAGRTFRIDRVTAVEPTAESFEAHAQTPIRIERSDDVATVRVRVHPTAVDFLSWYADAPRAVDAATGEIVADIPFASSAALVRAAMSFPGRVLIEDGDEVRTAIAARAGAALAAYGESA